MSRAPSIVVDSKGSTPSGLVVSDSLPPSVLVTRTGSTVLEAPRIAGPISTFSSSSQKPVVQETTPSTAAMEDVAEGCADGTLLVGLAAPSPPPSLDEQAAAPARAAIAGARRTERREGSMGASR